MRTYGTWILLYASAAHHTPTLCHCSKNLSSFPNCFWFYQCLQNLEGLFQLFLQCLLNLHPPLLTSHIYLIQNPSLLAVILTWLIWETSPVLQPLTDFWVFHTWSPAIFMLHPLYTALLLLFTSTAESIPSPLFPLRTKDFICCTSGGERTSVFKVHWKKQLASRCQKSLQRNWYNHQQH